MRSKLYKPEILLSADDLVWLLSFFLKSAINQRDLLYDWQRPKLRFQHFLQWKMFIEPQNLEPHRFRPWSSPPLPKLHPVVIMFSDSNKNLKHISFSLERNIVDVINDSLPKNAIPHESFVRPFISSTKNYDVSNDKKWEHWMINFVGNISWRMNYFIIILSILAA